MSHRFDADGVLSEDERECRGHSRNDKARDMEHRREDTRQGVCQRDEHRSASSEHGTYNDRHCPHALGWANIVSPSPLWFSERGADRQVHGHQPRQGDECGYPITSLVK